MSQPVSIELRTAKFNAAVLRYSQELRLSLPDVMRNQSRLLFGRIIAITFPRTRGEGRQAVARDVERAVRPLDPAKFESRHIRKMIRARDYAGLNTAIAALTHGRLRVVRFSPALHQRARDKRGRVRRFTGMVTPDRAEVRAYTKERQERVGRAKGGWAAAYRAMGGTPASWIARWAQVGQAQDRLANPVAGYVRAENRSEWAAHGDDQRLIATAIRSRTGAILADLRRRLDRAAVNSAR